MGAASAVVLACVVASCTAERIGVCRESVGAAGGNGGANGDAGENGGAGAAGAITCTRSQPILVGEVTNARELGGTPVAGGKTIACGTLYRGAPLAYLCDGCAGVTKLGIRSVVDLRMAHERDAKPEAACVQATANMVLAPMPIPYNVSAQDYIADLNATASVAKVFGALGDPAAYPVYVHCTWGRDRTGVMTAVMLLALGATREAIMQDYLLSQATVGAYPSSLTAVLDEIGRRGGIEAYLAGAGVSADQLANFRARAIAP